MKYRKKNLVVLRYTKNLGHVEVVPLGDYEHQIYGFQFNLREGKWSFLFSLSDKPQKVSTSIGRAIISAPKQRGEHCPIGVFDVTNYEHLSAMANAAISAVAKGPVLD